MTATTSDIPEIRRPDAAGGPAATDRVPATRLIRVELRKLVDTRAGAWLLVLIALVTAAYVIVYLFATDASGLTFEHFVDATVLPQSVLLPVLGIMAVTTEWTQRTSLVTHTLEPGRHRVVAAKFAATAVLGFLAVVLALAVAAVANILGAALRHGDGSWAYGAGGLRDTALLQLLSLVQGLAFGMLLMNTAAAIVLYFIVPGAVNLMFSMVGSLKDAAGWIDLGRSQAPLMDHSIAGIEWLHLLATTVLWLLLPLAAGMVRLLRREIK
jgi:ABC-type transport system involved in multi-copper enzyme maturation permease subunit